MVGTALGLLRQAEKNMGCYPYSTHFFQFLI